MPLPSEGFEKDIAKGCAGVAIAIVGVVAVVGLLFGYVLSKIF